MIVVSEQSILALENNKSLRFGAILSANVTKSGVIERFTVLVYKRTNGALVLQWEKEGKPQLPQLNKKFDLELKGETKNSVSGLTLGYLDGPYNKGMNAPSLIKLVKFLTKKGIIFHVV